MEYGTRGQLLDHLADTVTSVSADHPTRVAVDGPPAAGKTTLADELAAVLRAHGRGVIRATIDDFLFPRAHRYRAGEYSGQSCYDDGHDNDTLKRVLLDPLGPGGDRRFRSAIRDRSTDVELAPRIEVAAADAVLVFDGVFLLRPELDDCWEVRIVVSSSPETAVERAVIREGPGSTRAEIERRWHERYLPAQRLYAAAVSPVGRADIVVHNDDPVHPSWESPTG